MKMTAAQLRVLLTTLLDSLELPQTAFHFTKDARLRVINHLVIELEQWELFVATMGSETD